MRKITKESVRAFMGGYDFNLSNTRVSGGKMYLHGNLIAKRTHEGIFICNAGWESNTTKERLNGILDRCSDLRIYQSNFIWYIGKMQWDGNWVKIA